MWTDGIYRDITSKGNAIKILPVICAAGATDV